MSDFSPSDPRLWSTVKAYLAAKRTVIAQGYANEIDWQDSVLFDACTEQVFLREAAWVVLSSGMRESVIRKKFPSITAAFLGWESADRIAQTSDRCRSQALQHFNHNGKIDAILTISKHVSLFGFETVRKRIEDEGVNFITQLPFMGPATSLHLAKNLGFPVAKPDRHLIRMAEAAGYTSPEQMCNDISDIVSDRVQVVDLVLWRYATLREDYLEIFPAPGSWTLDNEDCGLCWLH